VKQESKIVPTLKFKFVGNALNRLVGPLKKSTLYALIFAEKNLAAAKIIKSKERNFMEKKKVLPAITNLLEIAGNLQTAYGAPNTGSAAES
jgi:hypothetical protein